VALSDIDQVLARNKISEFEARVTFAARLDFAEGPTGGKRFESCNEMRGTCLW
jgi:hypothetical protein